MLHNYSTAIEQKKPCTGCLEDHPQIPILLYNEKTTVKRPKEEPERYSPAIHLSLILQLVGPENPGFGEGILGRTVKGKHSRTINDFLLSSNQSTTNEKFK
jgi:hypothetical protein